MAIISSVLSIIDYLIRLLLFSVVLLSAQRASYFSYRLILVIGPFVLLNIMPLLAYYRIKNPFTRYMRDRTSASRRVLYATFKRYARN